MPVTPSAEYRDSVSWVKEMLPDFNKSCAVDPGSYWLMLGFGRGLNCVVQCVRPKDGAFWCYLAKQQSGTGNMRGTASRSSQSPFLKLPVFRV